MRSCTLWLLAMALGAVACGGTNDSSSDQPGADAAADSSTPDAQAQEAGDGGVVVSPVAAGFSGKCVDKDDDSDYEWDAATEVAITLDDEAIASTSDKVTIADTTVTITAAGTYRLSGTVADGRIVVNAADKGVVRLVLDNAHITSATSSAIEVQNASRAVAILADGTTNSLADSATRADADSGAASRDLQSEVGGGFALSRRGGLVGAKAHLAGELVGVGATRRGLDLEADGLGFRGGEGEA